MLYVLQMALYCLLFVVLVKCAAGNSGLNCLYFYPKAYIDEAQKRGIADKDAVMKKGYPIHGAVLYRHGDRAGRHHLPLEPGDGLQDGLCAVLVVMNWFDGIVIDRLWVGCGKLWVIKGMEGVPYVKPWKEVLIKRGLGTILYLVIALGVAGLVVLFGQIHA